MEQTLGHVTYTQNLRSALEGRDDIDAVFLPIPYEVRGRPLPGWSNWTIRSGVRARLALRRSVRRTGRNDALFVHTQVPAVLLGAWMRRTPTVLSLDATPLQYDSLGSAYGHEQSSSRVEQLKRLLNRRTFARADRLVAWSHWTKASLIEDYGVPAHKIDVLALGVRGSLWSKGCAASDAAHGPARVLFVGADLERKGGATLLEATRLIRSDPTAPPFELHLVTRTPCEPEAGVVVHDAMTPNSPELIALYHASTIFCLPTLGDCMPNSLMEAGAAGLALVSTSVGAIGEIVVDGITGLIVPPGDATRLAAALRTLLDDPDLCARLGRGAADLVGTNFDTVTNIDSLVKILRRVVEERYAGTSS